MTSTTADYIIVGGGLTGCVIASRLQQSDMSSRILLIEAGPDSSDDPRGTSPLAGLDLARSELDWAYTTLPQPHLRGRTFYSPAGKTLGGGSVLNYGGWSRGDKSDYDEWARLVGDDRWSYDGLLPFFKKSEHHHNSQDLSQHGYEGPIHYSSVSASDPNRRYPLREPLRAMWEEAGIKANNDGNGGSLLGMSELEENWYQGVRQPSHKAYDLQGVDVMTETTVQRIEMSNGKATGVVLANGSHISATKEIILTAGAYRTPQLLMLSGIGPADELKSLGIPVIGDLPEVGRNSIDHYSLFQFWKVRDASLSFALGQDPWTSPAYFKGFPSDWVVRESVSSDQITNLISESRDDPHASAVLSTSRCHLETSIFYLPAGAEHVGLELPQDGLHIASSLMLMLPTSRGRVSLASASIDEPPCIDPQYYTTAADRHTLIQGVQRLTSTLLSSEKGNAIFEKEVPPPGLPPLQPTSNAEEIDARLRSVGIAHAHTIGTAAIGKVVDSELNVYGVKRLRVADASVIPVPIGGHPQATLYALAERCADIILQS